MLADVHEDAFNFLCEGQVLGQGIHRKVFACRFDPSLVIKVEDNGDAAQRSFANVLEWEFWRNFSEYHKVSQWLAPCVFLSGDGRLLAQRRVDPLPRDYILPTQLPGFLADHKQSNFGLLQGKLVCVDYAITHTTADTKLKKAYFHT